MFKKVFKMLLRIVFYLILAGIAALILPRLVTGLYTWPRTYTVDNAPARRAAIIFGAGLTRDGTPTTVLRNRVEVGAQLYFAGKVEKLLMSGDNRFVYYNEPEAMRQYALQLGVPDADIVLDYAGRRTYDTCYRARDIFQLSEVILVTQGFHLPRAVYTCNMLGVDAIGIASDLDYYRKVSRFYWNTREMAATLSALIEIHITHPLPVLGDPEPIFADSAAQ
jgi:vancomycin permeability regulator SanA